MHNNIHQTIIRIKIPSCKTNRRTSIILIPFLWEFGIAQTIKKQYYYDHINKFSLFLTLEGISVTPIPIWKSVTLYFIWTSALRWNSSLQNTTNTISKATVWLTWGWISAGFWATLFSSESLPEATMGRWPDSSGWQSNPWDMSTSLFYIATTPKATKASSPWPRLLSPQAPLKRLW